MQSKRVFVHRIAAGVDIQHGRTADFGDGILLVLVAQKIYKRHEIGAVRMELISAAECLGDTAVTIAVQTCQLDAAMHADVVLAVCSADRQAGVPAHYFMPLHNMLRFPGRFTR